MLGHPRVRGRRGTTSHGMQGAAVCRVKPWEKEPRRRLASPGWRRSSARSAVSPGQGQEEERLLHRHLPHQTSIPEEALSTANALQQPPRSLRAWQDAPRLHLLQMDRIRGRTKRWRVFKAKRRSQPTGDAAGPLSGTSLGTQRGAGSSPKPTGQQDGGPRLSPPGHGSTVPRWWPGRTHLKGAGQKKTAPFSPKNVLLQNLASLQLQREKYGWWVVLFFPPPKFLGKLVLALEQTPTSASWGRFAPPSLVQAAPGSRADWFSSNTLKDLGKKREILSPPSILA